MNKLLSIMLIMLLSATMFSQPHESKVLLNVYDLGFTTSDREHADVPAARVNVGLSACVTDIFFLSVSYNGNFRSGRDSHGVFSLTPEYQVSVIGPLLLNGGVSINAPFGQNNTNMFMGVEANPELNFNRVSALLTNRVFFREGNMRLVTLIGMKFYL